MNIDQDVETVRRWIDFAWRNTNNDAEHPSAALDRILARITELEELLAYRKKDSFVTENHHAALARITELEEALQMVTDGYGHTWPMNVLTIVRAALGEK